jgi:hypothetical protein
MREKMGSRHTGRLSDSLSEFTVMVDGRSLPKRRRLNPNNQILALTEPSTPKLTQKTAAPTICASCHRAASIHPLLLCPRSVLFPSLSPNPLKVSRTRSCTAPTCTVCSRTCTARVPFPPPTSPTPLVAYAPTPASSPVARADSTRRPALVLNAPNTNATPAAAVKRKKPMRDDEERDPECDYYALPACEDGSGCGRTLCRECCFESPQECVPLFSFLTRLTRSSSRSSTTCYDCCAH